MLNWLLQLPSAQVVIGMEHLADAVVVVAPVIAGKIVLNEISFCIAQFDAGIGNVFISRAMS